ncbi:MAG TPA: methyltransferase domain-containing protein [Trueperaceae bacterium]|nr:methyltransferase domain-containing protein [Trueperaceae bacterium]
MSSCCRAAPCEELFDERLAGWYLRSYQRHGVGALERRMLAALSAADIRDQRVLEIGGGVGAIQAELLKRGAGTGEVIELVEAYRHSAAELAAWAGVAGRSTFRVADVLANPGEVEAAGVVVLNRVVCCSAEGLELVGVAAHLTEGTLLLSFPRSTALARFAQRAQHWLARLTRHRFRFYVRPGAAIRAAAESAGLEFVAGGGGLLWEYQAFRRP